MHVYSIFVTNTAFGTSFRANKYEMLNVLWQVASY